ncbi:hypothetical protein AB0T83_09880 [Fluviibacterium sp. DFM31]|uniref:Uncharacterized protein n=1 Tax=Meridianimarinicoccus marinus TaxID=3231483 RepID=A0ABV3L7S9_9RHOB
MTAVSVRFSAPAAFALAHDLDKPQGLQQQKSDKNAPESATFFPLVPYFKTKV